MTSDRLGRLSVRSQPVLPVLPQWGGWAGWGWEGVGTGTGPPESQLRAECTVLGLLGPGTYLGSPQ